MKNSKTIQFFIILAAFLVLGISFKVMVLVEGLTEVRPVNAIPPVAGLICGPTGAFACAVGNFLADMAGTFSVNSLTGVIGNFLAACLPYRMWHIYSKEAPNLHSGRNILLYLMISVTAAGTVAWILSFGLYAFQGIWLEKIYICVFFNNLGFSVGLGMPLLIMLTSDSVAVKCCPAPRSSFINKKPYMAKTVCAVYSLLILLLLFAVLFGHMNPAGSRWMTAVSAAAITGLICQFM